VAGERRQPAHARIWPIRRCSRHGDGARAGKMTPSRNNSPTPWPRTGCCSRRVTTPRLTCSP
jgi:hypothetical protein